MAVAEGTLRPLPRLEGAQAQATAPDAHVWLSASAGTGKTQVLTARVFRLLLKGVDPGAIQCLTFTKAGAAEMANRIAERLAAWVRMPNDELFHDLEALGEPAGPEARDHARTLFARVLDAPGGGIRIQTIHGFCQGLLAAFPVEAGLVPGFRPMDAREEAQLLRDTLAALLVDAEREGRPSVVERIGALSLRLGEGEAEAFLKECARKLPALESLPSGIGPAIRRALDVPAGGIDGVVREACASEFDEDGLEELAALNHAWGTKSGVARASAVRAWLAADADGRVAALDDLHLVWAKADGDIRSFAKGQAPQDEGYAEHAAGFYAQCDELKALAARAAYADALADALDVGRDYARAYAAAKRRAGAVDFDDLIRATVDLLNQPGMGEWVRYKLDQATEHVLIDEAQDTNPQQWRIVDALTAEFFAGRGVFAPGTRTLFTVGDFKQAIFGFQGTDPASFMAAEAWFKRRNEDAEPEGEWRDDELPLPFRRLSLTQSFRSTKPILEFVDAAIGALPEPGLGALSDIEPHASAVPGAGAVELWPLTTVEAGEEADAEQWVDDATRAVARRIARQVREWIDAGLTLRNGEPLTARDVMILVKRRGELASLLVARLYAEGVPVAGVDRLRLNAPLAVQDLLAAIRFVLQPGDDLSLASLLVSPLIGWSQDELMAAAHRGSGTLWAHLQRNTPPERLEPLRAMLARADFTTPYRFLEELLSGPLDGRRKLLRRLGQEARDPIEELLSAALDFETASTPSLQRFLEWFDRGDVEIVRDPSQQIEAVRVMTAHGAKGLQAPVVILADAAVDPTRSPGRLLGWQVEEGGDPVPAFRPRGAEKSGALAETIDVAAARELEEHWRLFYVATTRAEERLVIAGAMNDASKGPPAQSWYAAADAAMTALGVAAGEGEARVFRGFTPECPNVPKAKSQDKSEGQAALPDWAHQPAPVEARPPRPLAPSSLGEDVVADPPPGPAMRAAAERGQLIHALFERLPPVAPEDRADVAERWLACAGGVADATERASLTRTVLAVLDDPRFADLFAPDALAEAPIAAVVGEGIVVSGTVDRLVVTADRVRVIDFKTGRIAPHNVQDIPGYHLRQMAAYVEALAAIFPHRAIEANLLYTAGPKLFTLPPVLLAAHKPAFAPTEQSLRQSA